MQFNIIIQPEALSQLEVLESNPAKNPQYKVVRKTLAYLSKNPRHPGLNTHEYTELSKEYDAKVFEAYAQNKTPGAYRVFWHYGPDKGVISIIAITLHP